MTPHHPTGLLARWPLLLFGFLLCFGSSFGQTFFIALTGEAIRTRFELSHGEYGNLYSLATLASGFSLLWFGALLDRIDLRLYSVLAIVGLALACVLIASTTSLAVLGSTLFLLRLAGQGMMSHAAITSMAKLFSANRGKAIGIAASGHPAGEAVLPPLAVLLMALVGWQGVWLAAAGLLLLGIPLIIWLPSGNRARPEDIGFSTPGRYPPTAQRSYTRSAVLCDGRFHLLLPALMTPPFLVTGVFFHQTHLVAVKGWSLEWFALCFIAYALASTGGMLAAGPLIDRLGATRLMPFYLLPLGVACLILATVNMPAGALGFMLLAGLTGGTAQTIVTAMWAEIYGIAHLGAIRSLSATIMVVSTALAPGLFGMLFDIGVRFETVAGIMAVVIVIDIGLVGLAMRRHRRQSARERSTP